MLYRIKYKDALGNEDFARTTDSVHVMESGDKVAMEALADALNRLKMTPDDQWGEDFQVVEVSDD